MFECLAVRLFSLTYISLELCFVALIWSVTLRHLLWCFPLVYLLVQPSVRLIHQGRITGKPTRMILHLAPSHSCTAASFIQPPHLLYCTCSFSAATLLMGETFLVFEVCASARVELLQKYPQSPCLWSFSVRVALPSLHLLPPCLYNLPVTARPWIAFFVRPQWQNPV